MPPVEQTISQNPDPPDPLPTRRLALSPEALRDLAALVDAADSPDALARSCEAGAWPHLRELVERCRAEVDGEAGWVIVSLPAPEATGAAALARLKAEVAVLSRLLGRVLPQDASGALSISVWDRDPTRTMADGARYHQTHEGGSIHTDNVNQPKIWDYLVFGCLAQGMSGGESLLVDSRALHATLAARHPDVLQTLRGDFVWEYRGIKDDVYTAPVISYDPRGACQFRYLRPYVEAAHARVGQPLTPQQVHAFDVLDALLADPALQVRLSLAPGDVLITRDARILHGRTPFVDHPDAVPAHAARPGDAVKRTMERTWVERVPPTVEATPGPADLSDRYHRPRLLASEQMYGAGFQSSGAERLLDVASPAMGLEPGERVIDLGCGTGGALRYLHRRYGVRGTGVDGSADCVALAAEAAAAEGIDALEFVQADFRAVTLDGWYHGLWTCQSLLYVADKEACLRRVVPHLVPGRRGVLADYCRSEGAVSEAFSRYCADCGFALPSIPGLCATINRAGLRVVQVVDYTDWFTAAMEAERARLEAAVSDPAIDVAHLVRRWSQKIAFCERGDLRVAYVVAERPEEP